MPIRTSMKSWLAILTFAGLVFGIAETIALAAPEVADYTAEIHLDEFCKEDPDISASPSPTPSANLKNKDCVECSVPPALSTASLLNLPIKNKTLFRTKKVLVLHSKNLECKTQIIRSSSCKPPNRVKRSKLNSILAPLKRDIFRLT